MKSNHGLVFVTTVSIALALLISNHSAAQTKAPAKPAASTAKTKPFILPARKWHKIVEEKHNDSLGREYYLYRPQTIDPAKRYWLVVGVHGMGGNGRGAAGVKYWANLGQCIVVGPTFPGAYAFLGEKSDTQLLKLAADLKKKYKLHDKFFVMGFSGGSQFSHRFALRHPQAIIGCAAHAGGTWTNAVAKDDKKTDKSRFHFPGDIPITDKAKSVLFAISCGLEDKSRVPGAQGFAKILYDKGFIYKEMYWPGLGHRLDIRAMNQSMECFYLAAMGMGITDAIKFHEKTDTIRDTINKRLYKKAISEIKKLKYTQRRSARWPKETQQTHAPAHNGERKPNQAAWYTNGEKDWLKTRRNAYIDKLMEELNTANTEKALEEIKQIVQAGTPAARGRLGLLKRTFRRNKTIENAVKAAEQTMKRK